jgi:hypothetical protein
MINLKKGDALKLEHIYCIKTNDYVADRAYEFEDNDEPHIYKGKAILQISKEDFETCKNAGFKVKEYTQAVLASSIPESYTERIRQIMQYHVVYIDRVRHTNF